MPVLLAATSAAAAAVGFLVENALWIFAAAFLFAAAALGVVASWGNLRFGDGNADAS
jgi:hypothetical protein